MNFQTFTRETDALTRRYDDGDEAVLVADLGVADEQASVDVVDDTAILVVEDGGEPAQYDLELPDGDVATALINNGVVTIEVEQ